MTPFEIIGISLLIIGIVFAIFLISKKLCCDEEMVVDVSRETEHPFGKPDSTGYGGQGYLNHPIKDIYILRETKRIARRGKSPKQENNKYLVVTFSSFCEQPKKVKLKL